MAKFRVWSIKENRYVQDEMELFINDDGKLFEKVNLDWSGYSVDRLRDDDYVIEQGFKVDDKVVFVGDKVSFEHGYGKNREVTRGIICIEYNLPSVQTMAITWLLNVLRNSNFKIIGNIHENKELLK